MKGYKKQAILPTFLVVATAFLLVVFLFQSCTRVPAGPPWIDGDHELDFVWTMTNKQFVIHYEAWVMMPGDTFAFNGTSIDTTYTVVLEADGFIQMKVRAVDVLGRKGEFSEVSDTVWSITGVPEKPGKPFWIF